MRKRILNIGCGNDFYGTDRIDRVKTDTTTEIANIERGLPYPDAIFDEVYCKNVIEHIPNIGFLMDEIYRVLKIDGTFYIRTDHAAYLPLYISKKHEHNKMLEIHYEANGYNDETDHHYHLFVPSHLKHLFHRFRDVEVNYLYSAGRNILMRMFLKALPFKLGAMQIEVRGRK